MALIMLWARLFRNTCMVLGYVYPLYASYEVLEKRKLLLKKQKNAADRAAPGRHQHQRHDNSDPPPKDPESALLEVREEMIEWVTFWVVNACWWTFETLVENSIGNFTRLGPVYFGLKMLFLGWLVLPCFHGHQILFTRVIAPAFVVHEKEIDSALDQLKQKATERMASVCKETAQFALQTSSSLLLQGQQYVAAQLFQQALANFQLSPRQNQKDKTETTDAEASADAKNVVGGKLDGTRMASLFTFDQAPTKAEEASSATQQKTSNSKLPTRDKDQKASGGTLEQTVTAKPGATSQMKQLQEPQARLTTKQTDRERDPDVKSPPSQSDLQRSVSKSTELVTHFKKLLIRGFHLKYHATNELVKRRMLRLKDANSRYLIFERDDSSTSSSKYVRLLIQSIRNVASMSHDALVKKQLIGVQEAKDKEHEERWFLMETDALGLFVFEAESLKTRELLVAGLRLLVLERKRQVLRVFTALETLTNRRLQREALGRWSDYY